MDRQKVMSEGKLLESSLKDRAIATLAKAFAADPMFAWIFPDPSRRTESLRALLRVPVEYGLRHGRVTQADEGKAVAIWFPPGKQVTASGMIQAGMLSIPFRVGFRPFGQFMGANAVMEKIHKRHVPEPHWYLLIVGVDPELQGRGVGTALVKEGLTFADETKRPCYLETSEERNLSFYQRLGFVVLEKAPLGKGGPPGWAMRREAQYTH